MKYDICLFDLDGTLTDSQAGIINSAKYALSHFGIESNSATLRKFIGPPLRNSFKSHYGFSEEKAELAVAKYREYFAETGIWENEVYPGIHELLGELKKRGNILAVATSKAYFFAEKILERFELKDYFDFAAGSELDGTRSKKSDVINFALDFLDPIRNKNCVMIGDREHDINGAKEAAVHSIGVTYGYGSREELESAGAEAIAENIEELLIKLS